VLSSLLHVGGGGIKSADIRQGALLPISSMTGFARAEGTVGRFTWSWECKSVNGRGLEIRCRLPQGSEELEIPAKALVAKKFKRGNLTLGLTVREEGGRAQYEINEPLLRQLIETIGGLKDNTAGFQQPSLDGLFAVKGVVEAADGADDPEARNLLKKAALEGLKQALSDLAKMRDDEGKRIKAALSDQLAQIAELCGRAEATAEAQPDALKAKIKLQLAELLDSELRALPEERIAQEAAILLTKADVREEIDRLEAHIEAAGDLLSADDPVGRRLDFLCQEFNREANTICSKAADLELTNIGLELKAVIEQFREQVQNIE